MVEPPSLRAASSTQFRLQMGQYYAVAYLEYQKIEDLDFYVEQYFGQQ